MGPGSEETLSHALYLHKRLGSHCHVIAAHEVSDLNCCWKLFQ